MVLGSFFREGDQVSILFFRRSVNSCAFCALFISSPTVISMSPHAGLYPRDRVAGSKSPKERYASFPTKSRRFWPCSKYVPTDSRVPSISCAFSETSGWVVSSARVWILSRSIETIPPRDPSRIFLLDCMSIVSPEIHRRNAISLRSHRSWSGIGIIEKSRENHSFLGFIMIDSGSKFDLHISL